MATLLERLNGFGQSCWMDHLTRPMIRDGRLAARIRQGVRGVTTNQSIFREAITGSDAYDVQISRLTETANSPERVFEALAVDDVRAACDALRQVFDDSEGIDGFVSLEVSPHLAHDTEGSLREARRLMAAVDRPNVFIKIPGTVAGVAAVEQLIYEGINVNITLLFSIERYQEVAHAYIRALQRRAAEAKPLQVASVASFFLSRIDVLVDQLLSHRADAAPAGQPSAHDLLGKTAIANAKLAHESFQRIFSGPSWNGLAATGARVQRLLWASTSTKTRGYSDVRYIEPLIGPATVTTMPERTIDAFLDHGRAAATLARDLVAARPVLESLDRIGIPFDCAAWQLLNEGIQKFIDPYDALLAAIEEKGRALQSVA